MTFEKIEISKKTQIHICEFLYHPVCGIVQHDSSLHEYF
jgi:hypothetical protein